MCWAADCSGEMLRALALPRPSLLLAALLVLGAWANDRPLAPSRETAFQAWRERFQITVAPGKHSSTSVCASVYSPIDLARPSLSAEDYEHRLSVWAWTDDFISQYNSR
jgi:hypothetical protein